MKQKFSIAMSLAVALAILLTLRQPLLIHAQSIQADITPTACTPPPPNMVSWWPGDGNADDLVGTNHGTLEGGVTFVEGQVGQAFQFDGTGAVEIADSPSLNVQAFTIDAWVFPTAADGGTDVIINKEPVSVFSTFTTQYEIGIRGSFEPGMGIIPEGNFAFFIGGITGLPNEYRAWVDGGGPIPHNEWTHVALVFDGTSARTYINGAQTRVVAGLGGAVPVSSGPLKIGSRSAIQTDLVSPEPFNGRIDEVELFNQTLTSTEINAIYSAGPSGKCKPGTQQPVVDYFALGDSIASGYGLRDDGAPCYDSPRAYPNKVVEYLATRYTVVNFHQLACSGSTALSNSNPWPGKQLGNQVDAVLKQMPSDHPVLVSITIGANDFGWADPQNFLKQITRPSDQFTNWADTTAYRVSTFVYTEVQKLLMRPNVTVVVTELHDPYNVESRFFGLQPKCSHSVACYDRIEYVAHTLNTSFYTNVQQAIGQPNRMQMTLALHSAFHGHEGPSPACGSSPISPGPTWIQEIGNRDYNSELPPLVEKRLGLPSDSMGDCFHPNDLGAQVYADAIIAVLPALGH
jgi:lysophospholipase L1-like esterase